MKNNLYLLLVAVALLFSSCDNFVDIVPKGQNIPTTVDDLAKILNYNNNIGSGGLNWFHMNGDEFYTDTLLAASSLETQNAYLWAPYVYSRTEKDEDWAIYYRMIYYANYVLEHIAAAPEGIDFNREETYGRALLHRADAYWYLVTNYAPWCDETTAKTTLGVPMPLVSDINKQYPRSTVEEVCRQIMADIDSALVLENLPDWRTYNMWPCKAAGYALLSRIYLWQKDWRNAADYAGKVLEIKNELNDYNKITMKDPNDAGQGLNGYEDYAVLDPEVVLSKSASNNFTDVLVSDELVNCYDPKTDLRFRFFFVYKDLYKKYMRMHDNQTFDGIRLSEVYLNRIEALVRLGGSENIAEARQLLEVLRAHRYDKALVKELPEMAQPDLLKEVLKERRRELRFTWMRWFDLKRLNTDPETEETLIRYDLNNNPVTLEPNSPRYTWAIPLDIMAYNPQLVQNER